MFPLQIKEIVKDLTYKKDDIGRSNDEVYNFNNQYILKASSNVEILKNEYEKNKWISSYINGPKSILFIEENNKAYYLRECINGNSLISSKYTSNPILLLDTIKKVIKELRSLDNKNCPFKKAMGIGNNFIHGDLCLPNIYVDDNNNFVGFIDVADSGIGDIMIDYMWLIWSFEYNTKTNEYRNELCKILEIEFDEDKYKKYVLDELEH